MNSQERKTVNASSQWTKFWSANDDAEVINEQVAHVWEWLSGGASIRVLDHHYGTFQQFECYRALDVRYVLERHSRWYWHLFFWDGSRWARIPGSIDLDAMGDRVCGKAMSPQDWEQLVWWPRPQGLVSDLDFDDLPDADEVLKKYQRAGVRKYLGPCPKGKRSDVIWRIARSLAEHGANAEEIAAVLANKCKAYQAKAEEMGTPHRWLRQEINRAMKKTSAC